MKTPFLEVRHLSASFTSHLGELNALADISFTIQRGEFVCLLGPSGCGKSTLLRIIAGLRPPTQGEVWIAGHPHQITDRQLKSNTHITDDVCITMVFQQPTLLPWRTLQANVGLPLEVSGTPPNAIAQRTAELLQLVGLTGFEETYPAHLSGGMAQRAAIARALAQTPELLLLDEPFGALDALTRERMAAELLRIWQNEHGTVLMVTHSIEEAALLADRVIILSARPGRIADIIQIDLPRPRSSQLWNTPELQHIASHLREALYSGETNLTVPTTTLPATCPCDSHSM